MLKKRVFLEKTLKTLKKPKSKEKIELNFANEIFFLSKFGPKIQNCYSHPIIAREIAHNGKSSISIFQEITKKD